MKKSGLFKNIITGFGGQFVAIVLGLIVPRLFITSYGSDVNGLLNTIAQIFAYMALLEAGIGQATKNLLYRPFQEKNIDVISEVSSVSRCYYRKFTYIYGACVFILAIILPCIIKTDVDPFTVFFVVLFEGMSGVVSFFFVETPSIVISVDGKNYINNSINLINKIVGYAVKIIMASFGLNIILLQFVFFLVTVAKVFFYQYYFASKYAWIKFKKTKENIKLQDRNSYILTELCWTIFSSTDMIVLSLMVSTQMSSVYGIYNMVFSSISLLVNAVFSSINYLIGYAYHDGIDKYEKVHDAFNSVFIGIITSLMSVCYFLTLPFVGLYTHGVTDVNYIYESLPLMFCLIQIISWSRYTSGQLTGIAGYAKSTSYISIVEALLNLLLSIFFVRKYGIVGVTLATVIALPIKVLWCTYVADKKVMKRSYNKTMRIFGINYLFFFGIVILSKFYQPIINSYFQLCIWGLVLSIIFVGTCMYLNFLVNKDCWRIVRRYILKR